MFKSKLQEYCQSKKWSLPDYSTIKQGLDHCPLFKAYVTVNGYTFFTPILCKSSKEAQNEVAEIAFNHLIGSSVTSTGPNNDPIPLQRPKKFKDMSQLYKHQLHTYAQKRNLSPPMYISELEGPPHARRFKSKVVLEGKTFESLEYFSTIKDAENAAAQAAVMLRSSDHGSEEENLTFFKNLLQELVQKEFSCFPTYITTRSGLSHNPIFSSTVEINGETFSGQEAKTKKLAEMNAAKVAYTAIRQLDHQRRAMRTEDGESKGEKAFLARSKGKGKFLQCTNCNKNGHEEKDCWHKGKPKCFKCQKFGHIAKNCRVQDDEKEAMAQVVVEDELF